MAAHVGDDAVAAAVVAAEKHGHVALVAREAGLPAGRAGMGVETGRHFVVVRQFQQVRLPRAAPRNEARDEAEAARPHREVESGQRLEDLRPHALHGAAHEPHELHLAAFGRLAAPLLHRDEVPALADGLAFGHVSHGAGVDDHEFRVALLLHALMPRRVQQGPDGLAVAHVHPFAARRRAERRGSPGGGVGELSG